MLIKNKQFVLFFIATTVATLGEGIFALASLVSISKATGSSLSIGFTLALTTVPALLLAPFQGVLIDRFDKVRLAVWSSVIRALLVAVVAGAMWFGVFSTSVLYGCILVYYLLFYFSIPVIESMLRDLLSVEEAVQGMSLTQAAWQVGLLSSALGAGYLMEELGLVTTFAVAIGLDVLCALLYGFIVISHAEGDSGEELVIGSTIKDYMAEVWNGWKYVTNEKQLLWIVIAASAAHPFFQAINTLIFPFNYSILEGGEFSLGLVDSAACLGSLLSAVICLWLASRAGALLLVSQLLLMAALMAFASTTTLTNAFIGYVFVGLLSGNLKVLSKSMVIKVVERKFSGRVMSAISLFGLTAGVAASLGAGWLADRDIFLAYGATAAFLILPLAATVMYLIRKSDEPETSSAASSGEVQNSR